ncbi:DUF454 domain-containing protein [bacterium]|nr:DUF454 domain-containing protein [bacterium]
MKPVFISKPFLIVFGWLFISLGVIGIFLPLLPTTIFFILAAWCFSKSSDKFYNWLINHPRFGKFIRDYYEKRGMPIRSKIIAITMMVATITFSAIFFTQSITVRILLFLIAAGVAVYIISLNSIEEDASA